MKDKLYNNRVMKFLLEKYFDNNRKALAEATHKSESTVEFWFRTKAKMVGDDTLELLLFKLNSKNKKIVIPEEIK
jgi:hypothetical protein